MKCEQCNKEIKQTGKTLKIKELGIEVEIELHDNNKKLSEIIIPKGWRLLKYNEVVELANSKYAKKLNMDGYDSDKDFYIEQPFNFNKKTGLVARFNAYSVRVSMDCCRDPQDSDSGLWVRFCRSLK